MASNDIGSWAPIICIMTCYSAARFVPSQGARPLRYPPMTKDQRKSEPVLPGKIGEKLRVVLSHDMCSTRSVKWGISNVYLPPLPSFAWNVSMMSQSQRKANRQQIPWMTEILCRCYSRLDRFRRALSFASVHFLPSDLVSRHAVAKHAQDLFNNNKNTSTRHLKKGFDENMSRQNHGTFVTKTCQTNYNY